MKHTFMVVPSMEIGTVEVTINAAGLSPTEVQKLAEELRGNIRPDWKELDRRAVKIKKLEKEVVSLKEQNKLMQELFSAPRYNPPYPHDPWRDFKPYIWCNTY